jgi:hypothetical protein
VSKNDGFWMVICGEFVVKTWFLGASFFATNFAPLFENIFVEKS